MQLLTIFEIFGVFYAYTHLYTYFKNISSETYGRIFCDSYFLSIQGVQLQIIIKTTASVHIWYHVILQDFL